MRTTVDRRRGVHPRLLFEPAFEVTARDGYSLAAGNLARLGLSLGDGPRDSGEFKEAVEGAHLFRGEVEGALLVGIDVEDEKAISVDEGSLGAQGGGGEEGVEAEVSGKNGVGSGSNVEVGKGVDVCS